MALRKISKHYYGDTQADIREYLRRRYELRPPNCAFADFDCECGHRHFRVAGDREECEFYFTCLACDAEYFFHDLNDSEYEGGPGADLREYRCTCIEFDDSIFELSIGLQISPYNNTWGDYSDHAWVGSRCVKCGRIRRYMEFEQVPDEVEYYVLLGRLRNRVDGV